MKGIVVCTKDQKCLPVFFESIDQYIDDNITVYLSGSNKKLRTKRTVTFDNVGNSFGEACNLAVKIAFRECDEIVIANDDLVLNPNSWNLLKQDVYALKSNIGKKLGWVAARSNVIRPQQFICDPSLDEYVNERHVVAPIFGYIHRDAWIDFPHINWFSDDVQCHDMKKKGYRHFVSRCYVHHVGSSTIGMNRQKLIEDAVNWIRIHRQDALQHILDMIGNVDVG